MNPTKRIALIFGVIFLLPVLFFVAYEISSLNKDEKVIEEIYKKQLEAILFSVNQHSDNALESWKAKAEAGYFSNLQGGELPPALQTLLSNNIVKMAFIVDTLSKDATIDYFSVDTMATNLLKPFIEKSLQQNTAQIQKLVKYKNSGFQKTEVIESNWSNPATFIGFDSPSTIKRKICNESVLLQDRKSVV